jgi:CubicO group peptidase (beta-lactamase class C family)
MEITPSPLSGAMDRTQTPQKGTGFLSRIGLAWQIDTLGGYLWHNGGTGGFRSYMGFLKDKSLGVVVLANSANDVDDVGQFLLGDRDEIADFKPAKKRAVVKVDPAIYDKYVGKYKFQGADAAFTITRDGDKLMAQLTGQSTYQVYPDSQTEFFYTVVDAQLTFVTNALGEATHLILHQNGIDQTTRRVK